MAELTFQDWMKFVDEYVKIETENQLTTKDLDWSYRDCWENGEEPLAVAKEMIQWYSSGGHIFQESDFDDDESEDNYNPPILSEGESVFFLHMDELSRQVPNMAKTLGYIAHNQRKDERPFYYINRAEMACTLYRSDASGERDGVIPGKIVVSVRETVHNDRVVAEFEDPVTGESWKVPIGLMFPELRPQVVVKDIENYDKWEDDFYGDVITDWYKNVGGKTEWQSRFVKRHGAGMLYMNPNLYDMKDWENRHAD